MTVRLNERDGSIVREVTPSAVTDRKSSRSLSRLLVAETPPRLIRHCPFCGGPCYGPACRGHRDLLALDPSSPQAHFGAW